MAALQIGCLFYVYEGTYLFYMPLNLSNDKMFHVINQTISIRKRECCTLSLRIMSASL